MKQGLFGGVRAWYRPGSSDENVLREVLVSGVYNRLRPQRDERWLDLGANVGAFGLLCLSEGAKVDCYEPDEDNFSVLYKNLNGTSARLFRQAVSASKSKYMTVYRSPRAASESRSTLFARSGYQADGEVSNLYAGKLKRYDGIKLDIEGSEGPILDERLLPKCNKLVMEYHTSVDPVLSHFHARMEYLRARFKHVEYPPEFDRARAKGLEKFKTFFDRMVFAWND